ncbi:MAG: hypothetical protein JWP75_2420 [Frondihabitans sp.]|nr:hypothetical protein [Frondihabitans sp.]
MNDETQPTLPLETTPLEGAAPAIAPTTQLSPRIRWGGVIWGALFCAFGVVVMVVLSSDENRTGFTSWIDGLGPAGAGLVGVVALGAFVLILGIVGAAGRAQRPR